MQYQMLGWLLGTLVLSTVIFRHFPEIDLEAAGFFFNDGFTLASDPFWRSVRSFSINLTKLLIPLLLLCWLLKLSGTRQGRSLSTAKLAFPTITLLLGPVLITNLILKANWGRPRPKHLEIFGGDATFVLPWDISDQCLRNCSFVSGETSSAIWLLTLIPLLPLGWHRRAIWGVVLYTFLISGLRMAFGGHFLSDVIFSILLNSLVFWCVWGFFFERSATIKQLERSNAAQQYGFLKRLTKPISSLREKFLDK